MRNNLKKAVQIGLLILSTTTASAFAHTEHFNKAARSAEASYDFRTATMTLYKWYLSPMGAMVKGKVTFNKDAFSNYANGLANASKFDLMEGFPKDSGEMEVDETSAKDAIWDKPDDFSKAFRTFQTEAQQLADIAIKGDEKAIKEQFMKTAKTCAGCHRPFRSKK